MSLPTIVIVPGAWHSPEAFGQIISLLEKDGYKVVTFQLPSVDPDPEDIPLTHDIETVRSALVKEIEGAGNDVLLVAHSYGGVPASRALDGLTKKEREAKGLNGGVIRLVLITAVLVPDNVSVQEGMGGKSPEVWGVKVRNCGFFCFMASC